MILKTPKRLCPFPWNYLCLQSWLSSKALVENRVSPTFSLLSPEPHTGPHVSLRIKAHSGRLTPLCNTTTCGHFAFTLCLRSPYMHKSTAEKDFGQVRSSQGICPSGTHMPAENPCSHCLAVPFLYKQEQAVSMLLLLPRSLQPFCPPVILDRSTLEIINHRVI